MIYIFHGDDQVKSREHMFQKLESDTVSQIIRLDTKNITPDTVSTHLNTVSLMGSIILVLNNLFSIPKSNLKKVADLINNEKQKEIYIWQEKNVSATDLKLFPKAKVLVFPLPKIIFSCINQIKPNNIKQFCETYRKVLEAEPWDYIFYLVKNYLRKQLASYSRFDENKLNKTYLQLIELEFQNKTGQLSIPKEIALERIMINLMNI